MQSASRQGLLMHRIGRPASVTVTGTVTPVDVTDAAKMLYFFHPRRRPCVATSAEKLPPGGDFESAGALSGGHSGFGI